MNVESGRYSLSDAFEIRRPRPRFSVICLLDLLEWAVVPLCSVVFWEILSFPTSPLTPSSIAILAALAGILAFAFRRLMTPQGQPGPEQALRKATLAAISTMAGCGTIILIGAVLIPPSARESLDVWVVGWVVTMPAASGLLVFVKEQAASRAGFTRTQAVAISTSAASRALAQAASGMRSWNWLSFYQSDRQGDMSALVSLVKRGLVDVVVLDISTLITGAAEDLLILLADVPIRICLAVEPSHFSLVRQNNGLILADVAVNPLRPMQLTAKRLMDIIFSVTGLIVALPILLLASAAIVLETTGSPLYRQWRSGQNGEPFQALKFRTMYADKCDTTAQRQTLPNDPRVTRVGRFLRKTSIDELPQLINVLRGEMSLVGPRAHPINMKVGGIDYADIVRSYRARHRVKPGITGWAQVNGSRGGISDASAAHRRIELDLFYLSNWSVWLDLEIICRTILGGFIASEG
jgi:exopolysaccharide biosynthesis polyprenyl glycosylphosphotransferase